MNGNIYSIITGTGNYIPTQRIPNENFVTAEFFEKDGTLITKDGKETVDKFQKITTIAERRYVTDDLVTSDIAYRAAKEAIECAGIDKEELDYIIVAHNFGDVKSDNLRTDMVPSLAARVKYKLKIENPNTIAYDVIFGCPGWLQGMIQADYYIKTGDAKKVMVIGAETLSRVSDPHDRDRMIYSDGAGATILEARESETPVGILAHKTRSDTYEYAEMLFMGKSYKANTETPDDLFLKMNGRKLYQYALQTVPQAIKACLEKSGTCLSEIKYVLIHQANGKMDDAILSRLFKLYDLPPNIEEIMPMTIDWLGNSSVATIPTLLDLLRKDKTKYEDIKSGDLLVFASVGAGMNINAAVYRVS